MNVISNDKKLVDNTLEAETREETLLAFEYPTTGEGLELIKDFSLGDLEEITLFCDDVLENGRDVGVNLNDETKRIKFMDIINHITSIGYDEISEFNEHLKSKIRFISKKEKSQEDLLETLIEEV